LLCTGVLGTGPLACSDVDTSGAGGGGGSSAGGTVGFVEEGTLELGPLEERSLTVVTQPRSSIRLYLLGESLDASLNRTTVTADGEGRASFVLRAPGQPATFRLRATVDESSAELPVSVSEGGFADLRVVPIYAGRRTLDDWTANVLVGSDCATVLAGFPDDPAGALRSTAPVDADPVVESVPIGPKLAVAVRAGKLVAGCVTTTLSATSPGPVEVEVLDRPVVLSAASLDVQLALDVDPYAFGALLDQGFAELGEAAFPEPQDLAEALLDAMAARLEGAELAAFDAHRSALGLDASVAQTLDGKDARALVASYAPSARALAEADLAEGTAGELVGQTEGVRLTLARFGSLESTEAGFALPSAIGWKVDPGDVLVVSGSIPWAPLRFAQAWLARAGQASTQRTLAEDVAAGLDCTTIGATVAGFGSCDAGCASALCDGAVADLVSAAGAASDAADPAHRLELVMSGELEVDPDAKPLGFVGSWLGTLASGVSASPVQGAAQGSAPPPE
jgi:hypothetical protein